MINYSEYRLTNSNYNEIETKKTQIVLGNTFNSGMKHFNGWLNRNLGEFKKTAHYTITKDGFIYEHFDPKYSSYYFRKNEQNLKSIIILLENQGWLYHDTERKVDITLNGNIYNKEKISPFFKKWRDFEYWDNYTDEQMNSLVKLINQLCDIYSIPKEVIDNNVKNDDLTNYSGVLYKSNLEKYYTDLNPSWGYNIFKEKLKK